MNGNRGIHKHINNKKDGKHRGTLTLERHCTRANHTIISVFVSGATIHSTGAAALSLSGRGLSLSGILLSLSGRGLSLSGRGLSLSGILLSLSGRGCGLMLEMYCCPSVAGAVV
eukprot:TRINITY_DN12966_c0_g1_i4.p1 TRINITY_DN12966_c0_g1~~TRINITY_DN12966_c0_g1_i4.p1  ORF type:complete len:114 (+),score=17.48 TRINITY_DN12966_c0_g1_i4:38-379(+)